MVFSSADCLQKLLQQSFGRIAKGGAITADFNKLTSFLRMPRVELSGFALVALKQTQKPLRDAPSDACVPFSSRGEAVEA